MRTARQAGTCIFFLSCLASPLVLAQNNVVFLGGGYPVMCSAAAHNAENPGKMELTGSRLEISPIEVCTLAIASKDSPRTERAGSYNNRGVLYFTQGNLEAALADFDMALALAPEELPEAHINRGYTLVGQSRWQESIAAFDRGIELGAPDLARAYFNRGMAHEETGNVRQAYYDYLQASELDPEWEDPQVELTRFSVR